MEKRFLPLYLSQSFRSAAISLLSFFSGIYIFKKGLALGLEEKGAFLVIFGFFLVFLVFKLIGVSLAENLALKIGLKKQIFLGHFLTVLTLLAFLGSENNFNFLWMAGIFWGMAVGFFWFGWHGLLVKDGNGRGYGEVLGGANFAEGLFLAGVPFLGGVLVSRRGYDSLFFVSFVFILFSFLASTFLPEAKTHKDVTLKEVLRLFWQRKRMFLTYFSIGAIVTIYSPVFILYVFLFLKKEVALGGFFSLSMILVAIVNYLVGKWVDIRGKKELIAYGSWISLLVWLGRFLMKSIAPLFVFDVIYRIAISMLGIPLGVLSYQKAIDGQSTGRAILFREIAIIFGGMFICLLLVALVLVNLEIKFSFLGGMIFSLVPLLLIKREGIYGEL